MPRHFNINSLRQFVRLAHHRRRHGRVLSPRNPLPPRDDIQRHTRGQEQPRDNGEHVGRDVEAAELRIAGHAGDSGAFYGNADYTDNGKARQRRPAEGEGEGDPEGLFR